MPEPTWLPDQPITDDEIDFLVNKNANRPPRAVAIQMIHLQREKQHLHESMLLLSEQYDAAMAAITRLDETEADVLLADQPAPTAPPPQPAPTFDLPDGLRRVVEPKIHVQTRNGRTATVNCIDEDDEVYVLHGTVEGKVLSWTVGGKVFDFQDHPADIILPRPITLDEWRQWLT